MLVKWSFQLGEPRRHDNYCTDFCEAEQITAKEIEIIGRTIIETMMLYAGAESYVDDHGNLQLRKSKATVKIESFDK